MALNEKRHFKFWLTNKDRRNMGQSGDSVNAPILVGSWKCPSCLSWGTVNNVPVLEAICVPGQSFDHDQTTDSKCLLKEYIVSRSIAIGWLTETLNQPTMRSRRTGSLLANTVFGAWESSIYVGPTRPWNPRQSNRSRVSSTHSTSRVPMPEIYRGWTGILSLVLLLGWPGTEEMRGSLRWKRKIEFLFWNILQNCFP